MQKRRFGLAGLPSLAMVLVLVACGTPAGTEAPKPTNVFTFSGVKHCAYVVDGQKECGSTGVQQKNWKKPPEDEHYDEDDGVSVEEAALATLYTANFPARGKLNTNQQEEHKRIHQAWLDAGNDPTAIVKDFGNGYSEKTDGGKATPTPRATPTATKSPATRRPSASATPPR